MLLIGVAVCAVAFGWAIDTDWWPQVVIAALLCGLAILYFRLQYAARTSEAVENGEVEHIKPPWSLIEELFPSYSDSERSERRERSEDALTFEDSLVFVSGINFPRSMFLRISEFVEPFHRSLFVRTTYGVTLSGDRDVIVPLLVIPKGEMLYGLRVTGPEGRRISTVDSRRQAAVTLANIRVMVSTLSDDALALYVDPSNGIERRVAAAVCDKRATKDGELETVLDLIRGLPADADNAVVRDVLIRFVTTAAHHQIISVPASGELIRSAPWPRVHRFTIERRLIPDLNDAPGGAPVRLLIRLLDTARLALGVRLNRIYFPMREGLRTRSYHLEIAGPVGTFLGGNEIIAPAQSAVELEGAVDLRLGQRRAHAYTRNIRGDVPHFATRFLERAPGSFGPATMVSAAATLVIWLLASRRIEDVTTDSPWLLPGLLAVPVAAAALTGFERREHRHPSLLSYFIQFSTVGASLAAFAMATLGSPTDPADDAAWAVLAWVSTSITLISAYTWILRLAVENHFSSRKLAQYSG